ncbi:hypothetical protein M0802_011832 [Mischocyttarus mexicanus]|nr:hypothetical protein M0802_011844 [Mischocyttarus mexicanus]KAI4487793.1 hypothetical protein M0802_011832 [Mischocyttarus mexicanus]
MASKYNIGSSKELHPIRNSLNCKNTLRKLTGYIYIIQYIYPIPYGGVHRKKKLRPMFKGLDRWLERLITEWHEIQATTVYTKGAHRS